ncbi:MAG: phenylalanine--tRNA ligase subunit alpha [Acidobacteria bacterium]|nr:phenylalanine--tRNA ligase subunit alpha [Acidobacteriota bacterium]
MEGPGARAAEALRDALAAVRGARSLAGLREAEIAALGRKAPLSLLKRQLGSAPPADRPGMGRILNEAREAIEAALSARREELEATEESAALEAERVDVTLPGRSRLPGSPHPIALMLERLCEVFAGLGYRVAEGPEVETDWYNFESLNMPPDHPARSMWDTLYVDPSGGRDATLLRTHTSPVQIRTMLAQPPPVFIVAPGRVYRRDAFDASHSPVFHQLEGLAVGRGITFGDLKGTLDAFAKAVFGPEAAVRLRPSYFPFTEPSAEVDVICVTCGGRGCAACGRSGWIEIMGAGMVHPNVLRAVGYNPERVSGFAFGMGVERIAMRAWEIPDIRMLFENDLRFLARFRG